MKILTYYEKIDFKHQEELISLWEKSWKFHEFEPIILTEKDSERSNFYEEFVQKMNILHKEITQKPLSPYGLSCWLRWLAYSTQPEEKFYVSDYDVINHSFEIQEPSEVLHLMDDCCPCIASGSPSQFLNLCKKFIEVIEKNKDFFITEYAKSKFPHFHDQNFFIIYYDIKKENKNADIKFTRDRNFISCPQHDNFWKIPLVHYSHRGCSLYCEKRNIKFDDTERCNIINKYLNI